MAGAEFRAPMNMRRRPLHLSSEPISRTDFLASHIGGVLRSGSSSMGGCSNSQPALDFQFEDLESPSSKLLLSIKDRSRLVQYKWIESVCLPGRPLDPRSVLGWLSAARDCVFSA